MQDGYDHGAELVVVGFAGVCAIVGGSVGVGELEVAFAVGGLGGVGLFPRFFVEVVALDVDFAIGVIGGVVDEEAVVRVEFADGFEILDRAYLVGAGLKHFEEKAAGFAGVGRAGGVELGELGSFSIALRFVAGGGVGGNEGGVDFPALGIELASFLGVLNGEGSVVLLKGGGGGVEGCDGVVGIGLEDLLEVGEGLSRLVGLERGESLIDRRRGSRGRGWSLGGKKEGGGAGEKGEAGADADGGVHEGFHGLL